MRKFFVFMLLMFTISVNAQVRVNISFGDNDKVVFYGYGGNLHSEYILTSYYLNGNRHIETTNGSLIVHRVGSCHATYYDPCLHNRRRVINHRHYNQFLINQRIQRVHRQNYNNRPHSHIHRR